MISAKIKKIIIPPLIIALGLLIMSGLVASRKKAHRTQPRQDGALVHVIRVFDEDRRAVITGNGIVRAQREIRLAAQVAGRVDWVNPEFAVGGRFRAGEELFRIEQTDYSLAVERAQAQVAQGEFALAVARANASIAQQEWELMQSSRSKLQDAPVKSASMPDALVLHEPQLKQAEAALVSAKASLEMAELSLSRTVITAPFNCLVRAESIDPGQTVGPGIPVAHLLSTDIAEIDVGLSESDLHWLKIPGSEAVVKLKMAGKVYEWQGKVDRSLGFLEEVGRLAHVIVRIRNPFEKSTEGRQLNIGSFVEVDLYGRSIENVIPIPRRAMHPNSTLWVVRPDSTLEIRTVSVKHSTADEALIMSGLSPGDMIVLTNLSGAVDGMRLRPVERENR